MSRNVQTIKLTDDVIAVTACSIDLLNQGAAVGTFTGNSKFGRASQAVNLPVGGSFTFEYNADGYEDITIDATGTEIHIVLKF